MRMSIRIGLLSRPDIMLERLPVAIRAYLESKSCDKRIEELSDISNRLLGISYMDAVDEFVGSFRYAEASRSFVLDEGGSRGISQAIRIFEYGIGGIGGSHVFSDAVRTVGHAQLLFCM